MVDDATLAADYRSGLSYAGLIEKHGVTSVAVWRALRRQGVTARRKGRTYSLNEAAFDTVTEASAYWLGFLMADGCVTEQKGQWRVACCASETDGDHILRFRDFLGAGHKISVTAPTPGGKGRKRMHVFTAPSRRLAEAVMRFGVVPRKSHTARVIGLENDRHFWRGCVDGDGCVTMTRKEGGWMPLLLLVGARPLLEQFAEFVKLSIGRSVNVLKAATIFQIRISGSHAAAMLHVLYDDATVALARKAAEAERIYRHVEVMAEKAKEVANRVCVAPGCVERRYTSGLCRTHWYAFTYSVRKRKPSPLPGVQLLLPTR